MSQPQQSNCHRNNESTTLFYFQFLKNAQSWEYGHQEKQSSWAHRIWTIHESHTVPLSVCPSALGTWGACVFNWLASYLQQVSAGPWQDPTITGLTNLSGFAWDMPDCSTESLTSRKNWDSWVTLRFPGEEIWSERWSGQIKAQLPRQGLKDPQQHREIKGSQIRATLRPHNTLFWMRVAKAQHWVRAGEAGRPSCHLSRRLEGCFLGKQFGNLQFVPWNCS